MKPLKRHPAITKGVVIFSAIVLALAMVLPVLAEGPNDHGDKSDKSEKGGQPETRGQSGEANPGQSGQAKSQPDRANSQDNPGQGRSHQADSPGKQDQARPRQADSQGKQDQARLRQADSQGKPGRDKANTRGNKGKSQLGTTRSHDNKGKGNRGQAQGVAQPEPVVNPGLPMLDNTRKEGHKLQANPVLGASAAFTSSIDGFRVCRYRGKPQAIAFSDMSQGGSVVTISNTGGLKNLRITVNGQRFQVHLDSQAASNTVDLDVSSAWLTSGTNSIVFTALGKPGTCAMVQLR